MSGRVIIVGGGVTGLTLAYRLTKLGRAVTLIEARPTLGGNIRTERADGFVIEGGPDSFVAAKPEAAALCRELGLGDRLIGTTAANRRVYVSKAGRLVPLPEGVVLGIPTELRPLITTPVFSWKAKLRMGLDLILPKRRRALSDDESVGGFIRRRLGDDALADLIEPLLGGIYAGDVDALSLRSTFPQLARYEEEHGSLIRAVVATRARARAAAGAHPSPFLSLAGGMGELIDALETSLRAAGADLRTDTSLLAIDRPQQGGFDVTVRGPDGEAVLHADEVALAIPAHAAARALGQLDPLLEDGLVRTPYVSTATASLGFDASQVAHRLDAVGAIFPKGEGHRILAATFSSSKWAGRAPEGRVLMRVFFGGHANEAILASTDEELIAVAREELGALLGISGSPAIARVFRYPRSNPQPIVGHAERLRDLRRRAPAGLHFLGAPFDGIGIPDCVRQAEELARQLCAP